MYFHASSRSLGRAVTFINGGYYEKFDDGHVHPQVISGQFCGFQRSEIPELSASKSREAALFAQAHNMMQGHAAWGDMAFPLWVYIINEPPAVDLSNEMFDFGLLEEVRYRHLDEAPISATLDKMLSLPGRAISDVELTYLPENPGLIEEWGEAVKTELLRFYETGVYESPTEIDRPQPEAYQR